MARLAEIKEYQAYLHDVPAGKLALPVPEKVSWTTPHDPDGPDEQPVEDRTHTGYKVELGEVFCRLPDCRRAGKSCSSAANLRKHLKTHEVNVAPGNDGKVSTKAWEDALKFYRGLFPNGVIERKGQWTGVYIENTPDITSPAKSMSADLATKLDIPLLSTGEYDLKAMRKVYFDRVGKRAPCPYCRANKHPKGCGNSDECHVRLLFKPDDEEDGEEDEEDEEDIGREPEDD